MLNKSVAAGIRRVFPHRHKLEVIDNKLSFPAEFEAVPAQPVGPPAPTLGLVELVALAEAAGLLAGGGEAAQLAVLHDRPDHPVDLGVAPDRCVRHVYHDHLEVFVGGVLSDPVGAEHPQPLQPPAHPLLGDTLQVPLRLLLLHRAAGLRLAVRAALCHGTLASAPPHGDAVNDISCTEGVTAMLTTETSLYLRNKLRFISEKSQHGT